MASFKNSHWSSCVGDIRKESNQQKWNNKRCCISPVRQPMIGRLCNCFSLFYRVRQLTCTSQRGAESRTQVAEPRFVRSHRGSDTTSFGLLNPSVRFSNTISLRSRGILRIKAAKPLINGVQQLDAARKKYYWIQVTSKIFNTSRVQQSSTPRIGC